MIKKKLILGSANVNFAYGIRKNLIKTNEFKSLLNFAFKNGINIIDTSPVYGQSEKIIGSSKKNFKIITKIPKIPEHIQSREVEYWTTKKIKCSIEKLRKKKNLWSSYTKCRNFIKT